MCSAAWSATEFHLITDGYSGLGPDSQPWYSSKYAGKLAKRQLEKGKFQGKQYSNDNSFEEVFHDIVLVDVGAAGQTC